MGRSFIFHPAIFFPRLPLLPPCVNTFVQDRLTSYRSTLVLNLPAAGFFLPFVQERLPKAFFVHPLSFP